MCYYKPYEEFCQGVNQNFSRKFLKHRMKQRQCVSLVKSHPGLILLNNLIIFIFDIMFVIYYLLYIFYIYVVNLARNTQIDTNLVFSGQI